MRLEALLFDPLDAFEPFDPVDPAEPVDPLDPPLPAESLDPWDPVLPADADEQGGHFRHAPVQTPVPCPGNVTVTEHPVVSVTKLQPQDGLFSVQNPKLVSTVHW